MTCRRCGGFQLWNHFESRKDTTAAWEYDGWLCMNCGEIVDPLILLNRDRQEQIVDHHQARPYERKVVWLRRRDDAIA
ncbi:MAG TPA: hypothetical protein VKP13_14610 [Nitrospira sp.]|nr:hypothetical protein [Nitrospira sp.]